MSVGSVFLILFSNMYVHLPKLIITSYS